jgi:hypothetical protein
VVYLVENTNSQFRHTTDNNVALTSDLVPENESSADISNNDIMEITREQNDEYIEPKLISEISKRHKKILCSEL